MVDKALKVIKETMVRQAYLELLEQKEYMAILVKEEYQALMDKKENLENRAKRLMC